MSGGVFAALALVVAGPVFHWLPHQAPALDGRVGAWALAAAITLGWIAFAVARLARHRFVNPEDLDPLHGQQSVRARSLNLQLQNTVEQAALAIGAYAVWVAVTPQEWGVVQIFGAALFSLGRLFFFVGYSGGASKRALGFALTFYPTLAILGASILAIIFPVLHN